MTVIEFCRYVELTAWEEYAFEGASAICEKMIDEGKIDIDRMTVFYAARMIVKEAGIPA